MEELIEKLAELKSIKTHLQLTNSWQPNVIDTDRQIETEIQWLQNTLKERYNIQIYKEVKQYAKV